MVAKPNKSKVKRKSPMAMTYLFGSFFGAFMVASAFAYFNFKFTEYKFINFNKLPFFQERNLFIPHLDKYIIVMYSSKATPDLRPIIADTKYPIIAMDINQEYRESNTSYFHLKASINTLLQVVQRFNIYTLPTAFVIRKERDGVYKQNSGLKILKL
jgi:hypothetical protein